MKSNGNKWHQLTLFAEATPASPSALPERGKERTTPDTSGRVSPMPFAYFDQDLLCWKTLQGTFLSDLEMSKPIWPRSGTTHNGIAYQRQPSALRTFAIAYSLSLGTHGPNSDGLWPTATTGDHTTRYAQGGMPLGMATRMWPTPVARDHKGVGMKGQLPTTVAQVEGSGSLNPEWVEWLMGFPIGWTDLED